MDLKTSSRKFIKKTFVLQQDQTDCGIASLLSIVHFYGGENLLERLRELSGTLITGTTMLGLYQCAELIGFDVKGVRINIDFLEAQTQPCILHVVIDGKMEHYVTYYGISSMINFRPGKPNAICCTLSCIRFKASCFSSRCSNSGLMDANSYILSNATAASCI
jgi:hypothetical protein